MDELLNLLPLLIFGALFFVGRAKKKEEEEKKREQQGKQPATKQNLQERFEQALREVEQRLDQEKSGGSLLDSSASTIPSDQFATGSLPASDLFDSSTGFEQNRESSVESEWRGGSIDGGSKPKKQKQIERRPAPPKEDWAAVYRAESSSSYDYVDRTNFGFSDFSMAHGLHSEAGTESLMPSRSKRNSGEFHEAHGLHYTEPHALHRARLRAEEGTGGGERPILGGPDEIRRGIILAEILGPPRSHHPHR